MPPLGKAKRAHILARLERLHTLLDQLDTMASDPTRTGQIRQLMRRELTAVKTVVKKLPTRRRARGDEARR